MPITVTFAAGRTSRLVDARLARIKLNPARLRADHLTILNDIRRGCPACTDPTRCARGLKAAPEYGLEDWDEFCPSSARLRVLAALTMFGEDSAEQPVG